MLDTDIRYDLFMWYVTLFNTYLYYDEILTMIWTINKNGFPNLCPVSLKSIYKNDQIDIYVGNSLCMFGSDNGLSQVGYQSIIWTHAGAIVDRTIRDEFQWNLLKKCR